MSFRLQSLQEVNTLLCSSFLFSSRSIAKPVIACSRYSRWSLTWHHDDGHVVIVVVLIGQRRHQSCSVLSFIGYCSTFTFGGRKTLSPSMTDQKRPSNFWKSIFKALLVLSPHSPTIIGKRKSPLRSKYGSQVKERARDNHAEVNWSLRRWMYQRGPEL